MSSPQLLRKYNPDELLSLSYQYGAIPLQIETGESSNIDPNDIYIPHFYSIERKSSRVVAVFNLLSTIVGGGTLTIPYAYYKCGIIVGTIITLFSIFVSIMSMEILCTLSRKLGCNSYIEVMQRSLGGNFGDMSNTLLIFMLLFVIMAFFILEKDIAGNILDYFLHSHDSGSIDSTYKSVILSVIIVFTFPIMLADNYHSLRYISYLGTLSVTLLLFIIAIKSFILNWQSPERIVNNLRLGPNSFFDILTALPIILIAFMCQFNILGIYSNLSNPYPRHISHVIRVSIFIAGVIYIFFGIAGYTIAYDSTKDDILNNFSSHDPALILARCGLLLTIICQIPMVIVPCRQSILQFLLTFQDIKEQKTLLTRPTSQVFVTTLSPRRSFYRQNTETLTPVVDEDSREANTPQVREGIISGSTSTSSLTEVSIIRNNSTRYGPHVPVLVTVFIVVICFVISEFVPGVSVIW